MFRSARWLRLLGWAALISCVAGPLPAVAQAPAPAGAPAAAVSAADVVARGRYLVEDIALCWRCHSPMDVRGVRDRSRWLLGGQVATKSMVEGPGDWAIVAPRLAGSPPGTDEQFITLLMTGVSRTGRAPRQPMPPFRMARADAEAVLAYLKSLGGRVLGAPASVQSPTPR